jgi:hypothetical protein
MIFWLNLIFPREITHADLGYLRERPGADGFRAPRRDLASEMAQGGSGRREYPQECVTPPENK